MVHRPKAFIIFADLDGTFTPMDIAGKIDFVQMVKEVESRGVKVKFCPISGRPAGYVLRVLHDTRDMCLSEGVKDICEFGAAEQGALIVDSSRSYGPQYLGEEKNKDLKQKIGQILRNNRHHSVVSDEPDKIYTCSIHILNEAKEHMTCADQRAIYESVRDDVVQEFGANVLDIAMSHNCMEVMHKDISKQRAVDTLIWRYKKHYDVVGIMYAGDAENDKLAIRYLSRLAEIPGMAAHAFIPANAQVAIESKMLEDWKERNRAASGHRIMKGSEKMFKGITGLIREALNNGTLWSSEPRQSTTRDDLALLAKPRKIYQPRMPSCPNIYDLYIVEEKTPAVYRPRKSSMIHMNNLARKISGNNLRMIIAAAS